MAYGLSPLCDACSTFENREIGDYSIIRGKRTINSTVEDETSLFEDITTILIIVFFLLT